MFFAVGLEAHQGWSGHRKSVKTYHCIGWNDATSVLLPFHTLESDYNPCQNLQIKTSGNSCSSGLTASLTQKHQNSGTHTHTPAKSRWAWCELQGWQASGPWRRPRSSARSAPAKTRRAARHRSHSMAACEGKQPGEARRLLTKQSLVVFSFFLRPSLMVFKGTRHKLACPGVLVW